MSSFGNFVKKLRNEAGLSQEKLADKMDVSVNTIQIGKVAIQGSIQTSLVHWRTF